MKTDILIVGSGCSGLYAVLNLPEELDIMLITKSDFESSDSFLAQGGMCTLKDPSDYDSFFEDTLKAGHYENDQKSVEIMIKSSPDVVKDLVKYGVSFTRDENGDFVYTREGAHAHHRILFHEDITGKEITSHLLNAVKKLKNVRMYEYTTLLDILCDGSKCCGGIIRWPDGREEQVEADYVILATGGIGGTYKHSTNFKHLTGDGVLLKDNHIGAAGGVKEAVKMAKAYAPFVRKIEVEVETFEMVQDAVESGADIIMLDNMDNDLLKQSIDYIAGRAEIEISGNVTKENIERIKNFGVNYISSGALTHSAPIMDISLKNLHAV